VASSIDPEDSVFFDYLTKSHVEAYRGQTGIRSFAIIPFAQSGAEPILGPCVPTLLELRYHSAAWTFCRRLSLTLFSTRIRLGSVRRPFAVFFFFLQNLASFQIAGTAERVKCHLEGTMDLAAQITFLHIGPRAA